jgi:hypothetical protein
MGENIWTASVARKYWSTLDEIERALAVCPDELWEASLWPVQRHHPWVWPVKRAGEKAYGDEAAMAALLPQMSAFWNIAYHAIFHVDFYLARGVLKGFKPPKPFQEPDHRGNTLPQRTYTRDELLSYVAYCRERVHDVVLPLTDAQAQEIVARAGVTFGEFLVRNVAHTQEHAAQLSLFLGQHNVEPPGGIGPAQMRQLLVDGVRGREDAGIDAFAAMAGGYERLLPLVFAGFCNNLRPTEDFVVRFDAGAPYVVRANGGNATLEKRAPRTVDATVAMSQQDFLRVMISDLDWDDAAVTGRIRIEGDAAGLGRLLATVDRGRS